MSNDAGDAADRLSDALDEVFGRIDSGADAAPAADEPYELPPIISATDPEATDEPASPSLPEREVSPVPEPALPVTTPSPDASQRVPAPASAQPPPVPATAAAPRTATPIATPEAALLRAPGRRPRVRRVTRVLRHIDPWSTFKVALVFSTVGYIVGLTSGVLLWRVADSTGTLANVERWFTQFGWETFELEGGEIFHNAWIIGLFGVVAATGGAVLLVTLFNLVSDIVGGVRMTVLEEEVVERTVSSTRRYVVRNAGPAATAPVTATWSVDDEDGAGTGSPPSDRESARPAAPAPAPTADWTVD